MKVAVFGYGVVGKGVVDILDKRSDCSVEYICTRTPIADSRYVSTYETVLDDSTIDVVVEAIGGLEPAYTILKQALLKGKHIVTSNKALVAQYGAQLHELAQQNKCHFLFEGSVAGAIPILSALRHGLFVEPILRVEAILNGTSNYILTEMNKTGVSFDRALKQAQELGFAEQDPTDDVQGYDAARKLAILGSILTHKTVAYQELYTQGIATLGRDVFDYARRNRCKVKLVASLTVHTTHVEARVVPQLIKEDHPLYTVDGVDNAVVVYAENAGTLVFKGPGAGRYPTASAVVADVMACRLPYVSNSTWKSDLIDVTVPDELYAVWVNERDENGPLCSEDDEVLILLYTEAMNVTGDRVCIEGCI